MRAHCSGGTYMRSIAHDLGQLMGCGAHLAELRRLASAEFEIAEARTLEQLQSLAADERLVDALVPVDETAARLSQRVRGRCDGDADSPRAQFPGVAIPLRGRLEVCEGGLAGGSLVAIGEAVLPNLYHPVVVL